MANDYERLGKPHQDHWSVGVGKMNTLARQLQSAGELPETFATRRNASSTSRVEAITVPLSAETQRLVEHMRGDGYAAYETFGKSPAALRTEGMPYWYLNPALQDRTVAPALLAFKFNPSELFLKGSQNLPHGKQLELLEKEKMRVEKQYPGTWISSS